MIAVGLCQVGQGAQARDHLGGAGGSRQMVKAEKLPDQGTELPRDVWQELDERNGVDAPRLTQRAHVLHVVRVVCCEQPVGEYSQRVQVDTLVEVLAPQGLWRDEWGRADQRLGPPERHHRVKVD